MVRNISELQIIAEENGWKVNSNPNIIIRILSIQNKGYLTTEKYYCPCKKERINDNICPCKDAKKEIEKDGHCHCNLFVKQ